MHGQLSYKVKHYINSGDERSRKAKRNIALSFLNKGIAILISLAIIPVTIDYLNPEQYGIWLTLSSIVAWLSFFDVGLGHGFRNKFAEAKANGDNLLARKYVSTAYVTLIVIFSIVLVAFETINPVVNWASILNISQEYNVMLIKVTSIIIVGVCTQFALNIFPIMLSADQRPAVSAMISTIGQGIALAVIFILTKLPDHNMVYIAFTLSWVPALTTLLISIWMFTHQYRQYAPSIKLTEFSLVKNILNLGVKFFIIQISMILIFQVVNIILSRTLGPESVTLYNVTYKYFSISMMVFNIVLSPYWSAFTDAYTKGEFDWMKGIHKKLIKVWCCLAILSFFMLVISPIVYKLWLFDSIEIPFGVSCSMCLYIIVMSFSTMYMILLNGIGKIFLQMCTYIVCALISIPLCSLLCDSFGVQGLLLVLSGVYAVQGLIASIQLNKILSQKATGCWLK